MEGNEQKKVVIELQNVKRNFIVGDEVVHALRGVSFKIHEGEFVTIMGTSGSGKSTLLNQLGCLDTPTSGEYILDGVHVRTMKRRDRAVLRNRKIGFVFQNYNLLPKTTAVENVELPLMYNSSVSAKERKERAVKALEMVGLGNRLYHKSNQMSGGQMQRVPKTSCHGTHHHFRDAQPGDSPIQQPQYHIARRIDTGRHPELQHTVCRRGLGTASASAGRLNKGIHEYDQSFQNSPQGHCFQ